MAGKIVPLDGLLRPHIIAVDDERVYIVDDITIYIYSLKDFKLIKKFGEEGEGPREFKDRIYSIDVRSDKLIVNSEGRISHFTKDGDFIKQANSSSTGINYLPIGDYLVGMRIFAENRTLYFAIDLSDKKLKKIKEIYRFKHPFQPRKPINPTDIRVCSYHVYDEKIFIDKEGGIIDVYDKEGKKLYAIERSATAHKKPSHENKLSTNDSIERVKITEEYRKKYLDFWKSTHVLRAEYNALKDRFKFPDYFSPIRDFQIIDGKIYILTYKEAGTSPQPMKVDETISTEQPGKNEMLIYSLEGKLLKKALVPLTEVAILLPQMYNFYTIKNGSVYAMVENPDSESWDLHISEF